VLDNHVHADPPPLVPLAPVPADVIELCMRCLGKEPATRPTAREVTRRLARAAGLEVVEDAPMPAVPGGPAPAEPSMVIRPAGPRWAQVSLRLVGAAIAAGIVATAGWLIWRGDPGATGLAAPPASAHASVVPGPGTAATSDQPIGTHRAAGPGATTAATTTTGPGAPAAAAPPALSPTAAPSRTTTAPPATTTAPAPVERVLTSAGGTVKATCPAATTARILSRTPAHGYHEVSADAGPGAAPFVTFRHGKQDVTMTVTCSAGEPSAAIS